MINKLIIISLLWAALIFALCSISGSSLPKTPTIPYFDKLVHAGLYFILSIFILPVLNLTRIKFIRIIAPFIIILIVGIYGGFIEIAQENWFVDRTGDIKDFYSDVAGGILGIVVYYLLLKRLIIKWSNRSSI